MNEQLLLYANIVVIYEGGLKQNLQDMEDGEEGETFFNPTPWIYLLFLMYTFFKRFNVFGN